MSVVALELCIGACLAVLLKFFCVRQDDKNKMFIMFTFKKQVTRELSLQTVFYHIHQTLLYNIICIIIHKVCLFYLFYFILWFYSFIFLLIYCSVISTCKVEIVPISADLGVAHEYSLAQFT